MDIQLHTEEAGSGEVLFLLHGNGESSQYFQPLVPQLAEKYRVIAIDTRGHGATPRGAADFSLKQFAEDLHDFCKLRQISSAHILGFSDGGNIALLFALRYPDMVKSLILNGANIHPCGVKLQVQIPVIGEYLFLSLLKSQLDPAATRKRDLLGLMVKEPFIAKRRLKKLKMPVLILTGNHDMIRPAHSKSIHQAIPHSRWTVLQGSHFIAAENPVLFGNTVLQFLENINPL